jgi:hypothetical protein
MDQFEFELKRQRGQTIYSAVTQLCKWLPICFIAFCVERAIESLAGRSTLADFGLFLVADLKANKVVSHLITILFGLGGVSYGVVERRLREKNIERMSTQNTELERLLDQRRSSSLLTKKGKTRPEDRI